MTMMKTKNSASFRESAVGASGQAKDSLHLRSRGESPGNAPYSVHEWSGNRHFGWQRGFYSVP